MAGLTTTVWIYIVYLGISVALTVWVARTLHKNGRQFLVAAFHGDEKLADSVNHLLVVGFYLMNLGWVVLALKYGPKAETLEGVFEALSVRLGGVLLSLGIMHFLNLYGFNRARKNAMLEDAPPPVAPSETL